MVMLRRLAYPNRLCDLVDIFGRAEPELSIVFNMVTLRHVNCHVFMSHKLISFTVIVYKGCILHACMYFYKNTAYIINFDSVPYSKYNSVVDCR